MCPFRSEFVEFRSLNESVRISVANGESVAVDGIGTIRVVLENKNLIRIEDVFYVPKLDLSSFQLLHCLQKFCM